MSDPVSALSGASYDGFAAVREIGPLGMITLRAKAGTPGLEAAVLAATGCGLPEVRRIVRQGTRAVGWMSPDELLLVLPYADVAAALASIAGALQGQHHLAVDVSDARAVFRIEGAKADQVLRKLSPVDFDQLEPGELRRSRAAQVAAAFWADDGGFTLVCFRSVAGYVMGLLSVSARPGSEL
ncbi:sarcosine oxidase subunit gamma [Pseudotabrizicola alkalilacus]|uniref:Sarcosine oxidase subunit gamma n=1 Tax=Pseudotabrizicola alkalilacus TaxID=2305252 RepID=A0A411Z4B6_9RHOB|nr:sarcosine oxidase subunit gamma family protein [Pseudotabrizicola alkalilacus]RGP37917.1 sarcosine oxidase subunit gamma [Pseudotabrizicola alkalilacus]